MHIKHGMIFFKNNYTLFWATGIQKYNVQAIRSLREELFQDKSRRKKNLFVNRAATHYCRGTQVHSPRTQRVHSGTRYAGGP